MSENQMANADIFYLAFGTLNILLLSVVCEAKKGFLQVIFVDKGVKTEVPIGKRIHILH